MAAARIAALILALSTGGAVAAVAVTGCGGASGSGSTTSPAELRLERADLAAVSHELLRIEGPVQREVAAARVAWPGIAHGLPVGTLSTSVRRPISVAGLRARQIPVPPLLGEAGAEGLTGPAAEVAGLFRGFNTLTVRGWTQIEASIQTIGGGSPTAAGFARDNVNLYIDSVYDGHFDLGAIGEGVVREYRQLGGSAGFGQGLTPGEVAELGRTYSREDRLEPHPVLRAPGSS
jgi:hypothetical protein